MTQIGNAEPLALPGQTVLSPEAWAHVAESVEVSGRPLAAVLRLLIYLAVLRLNC